MSRRHNSAVLHELVSSASPANAGATILAIDAFFFLFVGGIVGIVYEQLGFEPDLVPIVILLAGLGAVAAVRLSRAKGIPTHGRGPNVIAPSHAVDMSTRADKT